MGRIVPERSVTDALYAAFRDNRQVPPLTNAMADLTLDQGYHIAAGIHTRRLADGDRVAGRKIGFTNRSIWPIYNVDAPVWRSRSTSRLESTSRLPSGITSTMNSE